MCRWVRGWWSKVPRTAQTWLAVVAILIGAATAASYFPAANVANLPRYAYGDRGDPATPVPAWVTDVQQKLPAALPANFWLIIGCGLALLGFAWIFRIWSISLFGRTIAGYALAATAITVTAGFVENGLLHLSLRYTPDPATLIDATAATMTVKWCAVLLAVGAVPATIGISLRAFAAWFRIHVRKRPASRPPDVAWWDHVLVAPEPPRSPPSAGVDAKEGSWVGAYNVPGVAEIIENRKGKAVQAICLSGGGVRSACVAMGAMQIFSAADPIDPINPDEPPEPSGPRLIDTVDYVISVSGGGFTAGALLLATQPSRTITDKPRVSQRFEDGSPEFDHFRRHSSYIADSPAALIRALAEVLKNLLASMLILFTPAVLLGCVAGYLLACPYFAFAAFVPVPKPDFDTAIKPKHADYLLSLVDHPSSWWAVVFFSVFAVGLTMSAIFVEWLWSGPTSEIWRGRMLSAALGSAVFALLVLAVIAGLPALMRLCSMISLNAGQNAGKTAATISGVVGLNYLTAVVAMAWKKRGALPLGELTQASWWKRLLPPEVLQLTLVLLTLAVLSVVWLITLGSFAAGVFRQVTINGYRATISNVPNWQIWLGGLALTILFIGLVDVTSLSLHPFYRRRLARTFAVRRERVSKRWRAQRYPASEWTWLPDYGRVPAGGPRFVFAAAAALSGEAKPAPGLNAVSYVLSADYIGGPELGWFKTAPLFDESPPRLKRDLTVQASIAVSGAAFASAMGRQDQGFEKLLAVSGARLGTWLPNPNFVKKLACAQHRNCADERDNTRPWPKSLPTIRGAGYFYRELFGMNYADGRLVQLSDGGHYENLGLVEALRRRCRLIFCFDGGGDTPPLLSGLGDAMRLAEYELGVQITLDNRGDYAVDSIAPGSGTPFRQGHALVCLNSRLTKGTVVAGTICYPAAAGLQESHGTLIFAKAVLWEGCPEWLLTYAASNSVFPHDSTTDQWFDEGHFAAYTQLGRIMGAHAKDCVQTLRNAGRI